MKMSPPVLSMLTRILMHELNNDDETQPTVEGRNDDDDDDDGSCPERIRYDSPVISFPGILGEVGIISCARGRHPESLVDVVAAWLSSTADKSQRRI